MTFKSIHDLCLVASLTSFPLTFSLAPCNSTILAFSTAGTDKAGILPPQGFVLLFSPCMQCSLKCLHGLLLLPSSLCSNVLMQMKHLTILFKWTNVIPLPYQYSPFPCFFCTEPITTWHTSFLIIYGLWFIVSSLEYKLLHKGRDFYLFLIDVLLVLRTMLCT